MRAVPIVVLLAALLAMAPAPATAQIPTQPCGPISIPTEPATPPPAQPGEVIQVVVQVVNSGPTALDAEVTVGPLPSGWTAGAAPAPASVPANGGSADFTFTFTGSEDAQSPATIQFVASGSCSSPLPTCPDQVCNGGSDNTQVGVSLAAAEGFQLPDLGFDFAPEYLIAGIVLVGLATAIPFAMRKKRASLAADCPEPLKMVRPGRGTSFPIELRNGSNDATTAQFEVGAVPEGWSAFMPLPEVQLAAREARSLWLMVRSPPNATVGDSIEVELRLRDARTGAALRNLRVRAEVQDGAAEG